MVLETGGKGRATQKANIYQDAQFKVSNDAMQVKITKRIN